MPALRLLLQRLLAAIPTLLLVALAAFLLLEFAPGDAADAYLAQTGGDAGFAAALREQLGLGGTLTGRLLRFFSGLAGGDLGTSVVFNRPVTGIITERLGTTLTLMAGAVTLAALGGGLMGLLAGANPGGTADRLLSLLALLLLAVPSFWLALLLIVTFGVSLGWLPIGGLGGPGPRPAGMAGVIETARHMALPVLALGAGYMALFMRTLRAGMVEAWRQEHVRAAMARGLKARAVLWRGVTRPALLPVVVLLGQQMGTLFGGSVVVETVFGIPGMGRLAYEAVAGRDPLLLAGVMLAGTIMVILANLGVDLLLSRLDPRIGAVHAG
jgi:peptide/nickel transport system permease protein